MFDKVNAVLDEKIRPALAGHGGGVELVKVEDNKVFVTLSGGCKGCPGARMTIKNGVEQIIKEDFPEITEVIDTTDHSM
jgi:Fe-S cluster biogenesis protein NfuA